MKIKIVVTKSGEFGDVCHDVIVNGDDKWSIRPLYECPEDAIIGRDLIDGFHLLEAIKMGYEAAKSGEELIFETIEEEDE